MERNAHRLTLHSPARQIVHLYARPFIDFAQVKWRFKLFGIWEKRKFTTIYCDATTMQHRQLKPLT
jgi:hypothetical protein